MSETDPRADMSPLNWSDLGVSELLPTGTVTLLLADVEASTHLWQTRPDEMTAAILRLAQTVSGIVAAHDGVRPVEQGEGDSFVVAFTRASEAVACALELQLAPLAPIRLRIGVHTGEVQLRDEGNYMGSTVNRAARLRELAHGGQTVLTAATEELALDQLPEGAWLADLGTYSLRDIARPERVVQLCHPDLPVDFPPLRSAKTPLTLHLPVQLTSFIGRVAEIEELRRTLIDKRLVTLTGAGGVGKTRLAVQLAAQLADEFRDGVWHVDLAPLTDPEILELAVARTMGLPDQPGRSTIDTLTRFVDTRRMLVVLDNCEHVLDAAASLAVALLSACPTVTLLATSREPLRAAGEVTWQVPSLSLADEAIELFTDRARHVHPRFSITDDNAATVAEICRRLDGMPLAIELAAARVRALSPAEILDSLHDRFRLLTGGARTAVRRQQTLRASVDWSHGLLTQAERDLFRRLAVFLGGFSLDAAQAVTGRGEIERHQLLDQLTLLVDKSLVVADNSVGQTRYRLLETVRQYALEKLGESGEADAVRGRHRDHYTAMALLLDTPAGADHQQHVELAEIEIDNLRAAFDWNRENSDLERALQLTSSLQPLWLARGHLQEGMAWFTSVLSLLADDGAEHEVSPAVRACALADTALLDVYVRVTNTMDQARQALAIARDVDDAGLLVRALTACGGAAGLDVEQAWPYFAEAIGLARAIGDRWRLCQILGRQAFGAAMAGDPIASRTLGEEGLELADAIGDTLNAHQCRWSLGMAQMFRGDLSGATAQFRALAADADRDVIGRVFALVTESCALAYQGDTTAARTTAFAAIDAASELDVIYQGAAYSALTTAAVAAGDVAAARVASEECWKHPSVQRGTVSINAVAWAAVLCSDLDAAQQLADEGVATLGGWHRILALATRSHLAIAQGEFQTAENDAHEALTLAAERSIHAGVANILECLVETIVDDRKYPAAARLAGAAEAIRQHTGEVRFPMYDPGYQDTLATLRNALGDQNFEAEWAEGSALSIEEAITYAQRGRGVRKRPASGWASLTPAELDIVRLVEKGLPNKGIAERLYISPRTVQAHLTHVYAKLGLTSRVQLAQEAARHSGCTR